MHAYTLLRPLLFTLPTELAHTLVLRLLNITPAFFFGKPTEQSIQAMGLTFPNPVGLAAGFDKNAQYLKGLSKLGFGFIEVGTVTPKPQPGNPKPRLFRLKQDEALINRMGFNNDGVEALTSSLRARPLAPAKAGGSNPAFILGINIGKNKATPLDKAIEDYAIGLKAVYPLADYITINISSPNTPDLRQLQEGEYARDLLAQLTSLRATLSEEYQCYKPLVIKISPDEPLETLKSLTALAIQYGIEGMIVSNTTITRPQGLISKYQTEAGGLSGAPLFALSTEVLTLLKAEAGDALTLIASGGIDSPATAQAKIQAGATLVQVYTGLIYKGPSVIAGAWQSNKK